MVEVALELGRDKDVYAGASCGVDEVELLIPANG
jgi:hypothetical protein